MSGYISSTCCQNQMIEYGEILPESGREQEWYANLSPELKDKLSRIDG